MKEKNKIDEPQSVFQFPEQPMASISPVAPQISNISHTRVHTNIFNSFSLTFILFPSSQFLTTLLHKQTPLVSEKQRGVDGNVEKRSFHTGHRKYIRQQLRDTEKGKNEEEQRS